MVGNAREGVQETDQGCRQLRLRILTAWNELDQRANDTAVRQWRTVWARVKVKGRHFEHKLSQ